MSELPFKFDERTERLWDIYAILGLLVIPSLGTAILSNFETIKAGPLFDHISPIFTTSGALLVCVALLRRSPWKLEDHEFDGMKGRYVAWGIFTTIVLSLINWIYLVLEKIAFQSFIHRLYNYNYDFAMIEKPFIPFVIIHLFLNSVFEEFTVRGVLQTHLTALTNSSWKGIVFANLIFASYHIYQGPAALIPIFILGVGYSLSRVAFNSLWPGIIAHTIYNLAIYNPYFVR